MDVLSTIVYSSLILSKKIAIRFSKGRTVTSIRYNLPLH